MTHNVQQLNFRDWFFFLILEWKNGIKHANERESWRPEVMVVIQFWHSSGTVRRTVIDVVHDHTKSHILIKHAGNVIEINTPGCSLCYD